jgi:hypothetical protein
LSVFQAEGRQFESGRAHSSHGSLQSQIWLYRRDLPRSYLSPATGQERSAKVRRRLISGCFGPFTVPLRCRSPATEPWSKLEPKSGRHDGPDRLSGRQTGIDETRISNRRPPGCDPRVRLARSNFANHRFAGKRWIVSRTFSVRITTDIRRYTRGYAWIRARIASSAQCGPAPVRNPTF